MMKDKKALDAIEAKFGTERPAWDEIESSLRALVRDPSREATAHANAEAVVDRADVADRSKARTGLFQAAHKTLKEAFEVEGRNALVDVKGDGFSCVAGGWHCSRKARSKLVLPDGIVTAACFQHEDGAIAQYAGQKLRAVFPPDDPEDNGEQYMIGRSERHESSPAGTYRDYSGGDPRDLPKKGVTVADLWHRLFVRTERVLAAISDGEHKEALAAAMARFADKWGEWAE
jgi:hypothetical protein